MKQSRFTEAQIIGILKEQEGGSPTAEVCRKHGISSATFYKYRARFGEDGRAAPATTITSPEQSERSVRTTESWQAVHNRAQPRIGRVEWRALPPCLAHRPPAG